MCRVKGYGVYQAANQVGVVTSGTFSPTLKKPLAMAYVLPEFAKSGTVLEIDLRGRRESARVVELPFYRRNERRV